MKTSTERVRAWRKKNPEKQLAISRRSTWKARNPESAREIAARSEAKRLANGKKRAYDASERGVARNFRSCHGLSKEESERWAMILLNPGTRCAICGLPNYVITMYREHGWPWFLGRRFGAGSKPRLTLDHIRPGDNSGGFRPLCHHCNSIRGAAQFTDGEVLTEVRSKWQWFTGPRFLYWLNSTPGVGGRLHRSDRCSKRDAQYASGATPQPEPWNQHLLTTTSPSDPESATSAA